MRLRANASAMPFGSMACASFAPRGALVGGGDGCAHRPAVSGLPLRRFPFFLGHRPRIPSGGRWRLSGSWAAPRERRRLFPDPRDFALIRSSSPLFAFFGRLAAKELGNLTPAQRDWLGPFDLRVCFSGSIGDGAQGTNMPSCPTIIAPAVSNPRRRAGCPARRVARLRKGVRRGRLAALEALGSGRGGKKGRCRCSLRFCFHRRERKKGRRFGAPFFLSFLERCCGFA